MQVYARCYTSNLTSIWDVSSSFNTEHGLEIAIWRKVVMQEHRVIASTWCAHADSPDARVRVIKCLSLPIPLGQASQLTSKSSITTGKYIGNKSSIAKRPPRVYNSYKHEHTHAPPTTTTTTTATTTTASTHHPLPSEIYPASCPLATLLCFSTLLGVTIPLRCHDAWIRPSMETSPAFMPRSRQAYNAEAEEMANRRSSLTFSSAIATFRRKSCWPGRLSTTSQTRKSASTDKVEAKAVKNQLIGTVCSSAISSSSRCAANRGISCRM